MKRVQEGEWENTDSWREREREKLKYELSTQDDTLNIVHFNIIIFKSVNTGKKTQLVRETTVENK